MYVNAPQFSAPVYPYRYDNLPMKILCMYIEIAFTEGTMCISYPGFPSYTNHQGHFHYVLCIPFTIRIGGI